MKWNYRCKRCGCLLDPNETYCDECEEAISQEMEYRKEWGLNHEQYEEMQKMLQGAQI